MTKTAENPKKMDTIFTTELPQDQEVQLSGSNQGGQIFFKHTNNTSYIYIVIGHGVLKSYAGYVDLSSDESSLLGKVIRVEIPGTTICTTLITMPCINTHTHVHALIHLIFIHVPDLAIY